MVRRAVLLLAILLVQSVDVEVGGGDGGGSQSAYFFLLRFPPLINLLFLPPYESPSQVPTERREASEEGPENRSSVRRAPT